VRAPKQGVRIGEIGAPDVAAIHDAEGEHLRVRAAIDECIELATSANEVEMQPGDRQREQKLAPVGDRLEIGRDEDPGRDRSERRVGPRARLEPGSLEICAEHGLIELHPLDAQRLQFRELALVGGQKAREKLERINARAACLPEA